MKDEKDTWNMYERVGAHRGNLLYRNVVDGEWKDSSVTEVKGTFKWYLIVIAVIFIVGTVVNFNYLGGIEGILTSKRLVDGTEALPNYIVGVASLVIMPLISVFLLYLAFKKRKK